jgi:hypothetical protein
MIEHTIYYYHSNHYPYYISFIKNKKTEKTVMNVMNVMFTVIIATADDENENHEHIFMISYEELRKSKNLYKTYILSLLMTNDCKLYDDYWMIKIRKNWKNLYITDKNTIYYQIKDISLSDIHYKEYYLQNFENNDFAFVSCNSKMIDDFLLENIDTYIDNHIQVLENNIANIEKNVYNLKMYNIYVDKICIDKQINDDIKQIILKFIV